MYRLLSYVDLRVLYMFYNFWRKVIEQKERRMYPEAYVEPSAFEISSAIARNSRGIILQ